MENNSIISDLSLKTIAYVGQFNFPAGGADSYRALGMAQSLRDAGYKVQFCTGQLSRFCSQVNSSDPALFPIEYINFSEKPLSRLSKVVKFLFSGYRTVKWLKGLKTRPDVVLMFGGYSFYAAFLLPWCKYNGVPLIVDVVEWFEPSHLPGGRLGPFRWNIEMALRYYFARTRNIIPISRYLEDYYRSKGCRTFRVPPTLDVKSISARTNVSLSGPLTLAYTGVPGKKDLLDNVLESIMRLDPSGKIVTLTVAGPTPDDILQFPAMRSRGIRSLPGCVKARGRVSREQALDTVRQADFSVLLRPQLRYAQAGFPTKVPESLSVGTPIMCNLTSDLGDYIQDGGNGIICQNHTPEAFSEALSRALLLTPEQRLEMRKSARQQAERSFDYRNYSDALSAFLQGVRP